MTAPALGPVLDAAVRRLRLLLRRRVEMLRGEWKEAGEAYHGAAIADAQIDAVLAATPAERERRFDAASPPEEEIERLERAIDAPDEPSPLAAMTAAFALGAFERDVVLLCLAPEIDADFELLFGYVNDDVARKYPTMSLALSLFAGGERAHLSLFAPLRRWRIVHADDGPRSPLPIAARPLRLDERFVEFLLGSQGLDPSLGELLQPLERGTAAAAHEALADSLASRARAEGRGAFAVNLTGERDAGKETLAHAIASRLELVPYRLDPSRLPPLGAERTAALRALEREARLMRLVYFVRASRRELPDVQLDVAMEDVVETLEAPLLLDSADAWHGTRPMLVARVERPDRHEQRRMWLAALGDEELAPAIDDLVEQFDLSPETIARAARSLGPHPNRAALWEASRQQGGWRVDELAQRIPPLQRWRDIVLRPDALAQLREIAAQVAQRARVYDHWGFGARLSRGRGITALFAGPSGTGKTMAAEIIAGELALELYRIDLAGVVNKYIGETEKNLGRLFDAAERTGAVLFFDEADALFGKRTEVKDSHDVYANMQVNYLLQRMEDYRGLAILATNRKSALDRAFLRRLRFVIDFPFPDRAARQQIWRLAFPPEAPVGALDFEFLSGLEIAGGNIHNIAINAAFLAAGGGTIEERHVMHAVRREYAKMQKLITETEFGDHFREAV